MRGFTTPRATTVTLSRGEEVVEFTVYPLPVGWWSALRSAFPPPVLYENHVEKPNRSKATEYADLFGFLQLAKHLEPGGVLDTAIPPLSGTRPQIEAAARAIRDEFRAANFTDGEVGHLISAGIDLNKSEDSLASLGNSPSGSPPTPGG